MFKSYLFIILTLILLVSVGCEDNTTPILDEAILTDYIAINSDRELDDLIACAAGQAAGFPSSGDEPTSVFFYPITGAKDFRYFEAEDLADSANFGNYIRKPLDVSPVFNGYLWKFNNTSFDGERMGVVTYLTDDKLHVSTPIRLKTNFKPTEINNDLLTIEQNGVTPRFEWNDGSIEENVIYFQVISDSSSNLISGTYTFDKNFTFYDTGNVVLNITPTTPIPELASGQTYTFTMMAVSEDNWVNLLIEKSFVIQ